MKTKNHILLLAGTFLIAACQGPVKITRPDPITLEQGLTELADALKLLNKLSDDTENSEKIGLVPSQVQIQLQVGVSEQDGGTRQLQIIPGDIVAEIGSLTGTRTVQVNQNSASTITLTFTNYLFAGTNQVVGSKKIDEIDALKNYLINGSVGVQQFPNPSDAPAVKFDVPLPKGQKGILESPIEDKE